MNDDSRFTESAMVSAEVANRAINDALQFASPTIGAALSQRDIAIAEAGAAACYGKAYTFGSSKRAFCDMGFDFAAIAASVPATIESQRAALSPDSGKGEVAELRVALTLIARWALPETGEKWEDGTPMSYGGAFGSNGERDYMRKVALDALASRPAAHVSAPTDCLHDDTIRLGAIWTACQQCGKRWADDEVTPADSSAAPSDFDARRSVSIALGLDDADTVGLVNGKRACYSWSFLLDTIKALAAEPAPVSAQVSESDADVFRIVKRKDDTEAWLVFDGGMVCLNNIANERGPITRDRFSSAIDRFLKSQPAAPVAVAPSPTLLDAIERKLATHRQPEDGAAKAEPRTVYGADGKFLGIARKSCEPATATKEASVQGVPESKGGAR